MLALQRAARAASAPSTEAPEGLLVSTVVPPVANIAARLKTVSTILEQTRGEPLIWLHGAHGVGKSVLARLIATEVSGAWLALDLARSRRTGEPH